MNKERINELRRQLSKLEARRKELFEIEDYREYRDAIPEINVLRDKIWQLYEEIELLREPDFSNGVIDVYSEEGNEENYYITVSGNKERIGHIRVTWESFSRYLGNIGYSLDENYRGHHYTLQALELLRDTMIEKGLTKPIITVYPDNIPSIKTIEKFGGVLIQEANEEQNWNTYEVDLLENKPSKKH